MSELILSCDCGALGATVCDAQPATANRVRCSCRYCQAAAHRFGRAAHLGPYEGTERFQVAPSTFNLMRGREHLRCLQLSDGGALRWYAGCCESPIALTLDSKKVPFLALEAAAVREPESLDAALGPLRAHVNATVPRRERRAARATIGALLGMLAHLIPLFFGWWWRGERSVLFDDDGPVEPPQREDPERVRALLEAVNSRAIVNVRPRSFGC